MVQVLGSLVALGETWMGFQASGFHLAQLQAVAAILGSGQYISISFFSVTLPVEELNISF